jgi:hypothetical protein
MHTLTASTLATLQLTWPQEKLAHLRREVVLHKQSVAEMQQEHHQGQGRQQQLECLKEQQLQLQLQ